MMKSFLVWGLLFTCNRLAAQELINSDRPDQTDGTETVTKKHVQIETGAEFSKQDLLTHLFNNTTLIRYGVTDKFEIRLLNQYELLKDSNTIDGFQPLTLSCKNLLWKQRRLLPEMTIITYLQLPVTFSKTYPGNHFGYSIAIATKHELSNIFSFYSNFGIEQEQASMVTSYPTTAELNMAVSKKLSAFIEYYGTYAVHTSAANGMDVGIIYAFKKNISVDLAAGSSNLKLRENRYISFGFAARLPD